MILRGRAYQGGANPRKAISLGIDAAKAPTARAPRHTVAYHVRLFVLAARPADQSLSQGFAETWRAFRRRFEPADSHLCLRVGKGTYNLNASPKISKQVEKSQGQKP